MNKCKLCMLLSGVLILIFCFSAHATTSYKTLEIYNELHVFEDYLNSLDPQKINLGIQTISIEDERWQEASKRTPNKINSVLHTNEGNVILKNDSFDFEIIFMPAYLPKKIKWTCKIKDQSIFFKPKPCEAWKKEIEQGRKPQ